MNTRNAPLSPVSIGGSSEWSGATKYQADGLYPNNRGLVSPPDSGSPSGMMNGFPGGPRSVGGPSPPPSVGRSSTYARSESGRSIREESTESVLGEHYVALRRYLTSTSKDGRANPPPNKARDKLLRLSSVQFLELSTDVFDELMRRQIKRPPPGAPPNGGQPPYAGPPPYLLPEPNFHPKRNQARQKLSTLGSPRFRDLATDVFCELERRIPAFVASVTPRRSTPGAPPGGPPGGPSRTGTPVNGMGLPGGPNGAMRRPSDASSIRSAGPPRVPNDFPVPSSPVVPTNGNFDRQFPKMFQNNRPLPKLFQSNTIVPNKSTMVEEDDDGLGSNDDDNDSFKPRSRSSKEDIPTPASEVDNKLIDDYRTQVQDLRTKIEGMETDMKRKDEELIALKDGERSQATASNLEKKQWDDVRTTLENKLADAEGLNTSIRNELERLRDEHATEIRALREEIEEARQNTRGVDDSETIRENRELRMALQEQQQVTEGARREARQFLEEMRTLSQQHMPSWEKQTELERTVEQLEKEVRDWRNRYARAKTELRTMRASSIGLTIETNAAKYIQEKGFGDVNGLVKDVHVTKFQISIDELLRRARTDEPQRVIDGMKSVIVNVRRITKDIEDSQSGDEELMRQQQKLKNRVSATANNLITASKNFASAAGLSPVSLLDAAASHLVAALVELLRTVKIRATPATELGDDDDDDDSITPVESAGFFSNRTTATQPDAFPQSAGSPRDNLEDLKIYLEDQTAIMVQTIQNLVGSIRGDAPIQEISQEITSIAEVVSKVVAATETSRTASDMLERLSACRQRLLEAGDHGKNLAARGLGEDDREWRMWTQTLPPIAFEIVRETQGISPTY
ncbi:hypothetical protein NUW58_g2755 [Xylaria curta]|uniref:Uncharacterized protein n=1 Tax=Xylaria curta TaxID=42375 RepID=A0ACC1PGQ2_9PEZI|nr:hypothetical protein NUW58_g2755 [Xylaria curta]